MVIIINQPKLEDIESLPLFSGNNLIYENSGHVLTRNKGFYICSQKCKGTCSIKTEKKLSIVNFERKFIRQTKPLIIKDEDGRKLFYEIDREAIEIREKTEENLRLCRDVISTTPICIRQDLKKNKFNNRDFSDLVEHYFKILKISFPVFLITLLQSYLKAFATGDKILVGTFSGMINNLYIKDDGKISKIKINGLGNYFFQYLEANVFGYPKNFKIPIVDRIKFPSLKLTSVISYFEQNNYRDITNYSMFASEYAEKKQKEELYTWLKQLKPDELMSWAIYLRDQLWQMPMAQFSNGYKYNYGKNREE